MKRIVCTIVILSVWSVFLSMAQRPVIKFPIYYMETEYDYFQIVELPRDTVYVRDTVYISDMDAFFKEYSGYSFKEFADRYMHTKSAIDSLNAINEERLYYNFFLARDTFNTLSNRFVVKEFEVYPDTTLFYHDKVNDIAMVKDQRSVRKEILFRCTGEKATSQLLKNPDAVKRVISALFSEMQQLYDDSIHIEGINLYFPDYNFKEKRAMAQFIKSVRIIMDASQHFKYTETRLNVTFNTYDGEEVDRNYQYCLLQDVSEVISLDYRYPIDSCYLKGYRLVRSESNMTDISLVSQIVNHIYIARFYIGHLDKDAANLTDFSEHTIEPYLKVDFLDNDWEIYMFILIGVFVVLLVLAIIYFFSKRFSDFINHNSDSVLIISIVLILEILALIVILFQNLNHEDNFMLMSKNPLILFSMPSLVILIIPIFKQMSKKGRIP